MNLVGASGGDGHDDLAEHVSEIIWGHASAVDATLEEPVVGFGHTLGDHSVVVVAKGDRAGQVKHNVAISVFEVVSP